MHKSQPWVSLRSVLIEDDAEFSRNALEDGLPPDIAERMLLYMVCGFVSQDNESGWVDGAYDDPKLGSFSGSRIPLCYLKDSAHGNKRAQALDAHAIIAEQPDLAEIFIHPMHVTALKGRLDRVLQQLNAPTADVVALF